MRIHWPRSLALSAIHPELPRRRGSVDRERFGCQLRDHPPRRPTGVARSCHQRVLVPHRQPRTDERPTARRLPLASACTSPASSRSVSTAGRAPRNTPADSDRRAATPHHATARALQASTDNPPAISTLLSSSAYLAVERRPESADGRQACEFNAYPMSVRPRINCLLNWSHVTVPEIGDPCSCFSNTLI
jgi:hypothetical protein